MDNMTGEQLLTFFKWLMVTSLVGSLGWAIASMYWWGKTEKYEEGDGDDNARERNDGT